jgi:GAF domain-containing protein
MSDPAQKSPEPQPAPPGRAARRERYLACLAELSTRLLRAPDPLVVLDLAVESLRDASGADRCYVIENHAGEQGAVSTTLRAEACRRGRGDAQAPQTISAPFVIFGAASSLAAAAAPCGPRLPAAPCSSSRDPPGRLLPIRWRNWWGR